MTPASPASARAPEFLVSAVVGWLDGLPPGEFARLADAEASVAPALIAQWPAWQVRFARGMLGPTGEETLRRAGAATWDAVVDALLMARPPEGLVAWAHRDWFASQMDACRDLFLRA